MQEIKASWPKIFFQTLFKLPFFIHSNDTTQSSVTQAIVASNKRDFSEKSKKVNKTARKDVFGSNSPLFNQMDFETLPGETSAHISFQDSTFLTSPRGTSAQISPETPIQVSPAIVLPPKKRTSEPKLTSAPPKTPTQPLPNPVDQEAVIEIDDPATVYLPLFNKSATDQTNYL